MGGDDARSHEEDALTLDIREIAARGYRSLRAIRFPLRRLSLFRGANGVGKTNLCCALSLVFRKEDE